MKRGNGWLAQLRLHRYSPGMCSPGNRFQPFFLLVLLLAGCATPLPESAYYRYSPGPTGQPPAQLSGGTCWNTDVAALLLLNPPTRTNVVGIDGKVVKGDKPVLLAPGTHTVVLQCRWDAYLRFGELTATFQPGTQYTAKTLRGFGKAPPYTFFIEEKSTGRRIAQDLPRASGIAPRIPVPVFTPAR